MARRRSYQRDDVEDDEASDEAPLRRRRRRPRRRWRLLLVLLIIVGLVAAAPTIVSRTALRDLVLARALPPQAARLTATDANFSWIGGQSLAGVTLTDAAGNPLATVESATIDRSLIALIAGGRDLGKIVLVRPTLRLDTRAGGSNLEDFVQKLAEAPRPTPTEGRPHEPASIELEIVEGAILGRDLTTGQAWRVEQLAATAKNNPQAAGWDVVGAGLLSLAGVEGQVAPAAIQQGPPAAALQNAAGRFKFRYHDATGEGRQVELIADRLPLAPIEPWLARVAPAARLTGDASTDLKLAWTAEAAPATGVAPAVSAPATPTKFTAKGKLDAVAVRFTAAALSGDIVELPTASLSLDASLEGNSLSATQLRAECDWLQTEVRGDFDLASLKGINVGALPKQDASVSARVDLPQLARMLPRTLRLREGVRIDSGTLEFTAESTTADAAAARGALDGKPRHWAVAAIIENVLGSDGRREIRWAEPVEVTLDAVDSPTGPQVQRAILQSSFAAAKAEVVDEGFQGEMEFNLSQLADQLGQFVDLAAWNLRGTGKGKFLLRNTDESGFVATADMDLRDIDVRRNGEAVWVDPQLHAELKAGGQRRGWSPVRVDTASALVRGPQDTLSLELLEPVDLRESGRSWLVKINGNGPLDLWAGRLRPWAPSVPQGIAGQSTVAAQVRAGEGLVHIALQQLAIEQLQAQVGATQIVEPRVEAAGDFRWDAAARSIQADALQFTSSTLAARARGVSLQLGQGPPVARGDIAVRGDLERLASWFGMVGGEGFWPRGQATGRVELASDARQATVSLTLNAEPFQLMRAPAPGPLGVVAGGPELAWDEPRLAFATQATYANADDRLQLTGLQVQGKTIQLGGGASVDQLRTAGLVRGDVQLSYDATELGRLLTAYLGPDVQITGANTARLQAAGRLREVGLATTPASPVSITGEIAPARTHWSRRWQVSGETGWSAANLYGLPIGAAQIVANLREGQLVFNPLDLAVGEGRIATQPRVVFDPAPGRLLLPPGPMISNVAVSTEVSQRMLKYAAPIVAGATQTQGSFSFFLDSAEIPLRQPKQTRLAGRLTIHSLAVLPGPMIQEVVGLIRQIEAIGKNGQDLGRGLGGLLGGGAAAPAQPIKGITMSQRTIDVQIVDGRVYHRNLEFLVDDVPVRSSGYVGFDESLAITIEVPIQAKWVGDKPALQPLIGQILQIPVSGTLSRWDVDERAIGNFLGQAAQSAAGGLIEGEINRALDRILKPR